MSSFYKIMCSYRLLVGSYRLLVVGIVLDIVFTTISWKVVGDFRFEYNPFIPDRIYIVLLINIVLLICGAWSIVVRYFYNIIRLLALSTHFLLWYYVATGTYIFPIQKGEASITLSILLPVIILGVEKISIKIFTLYLERRLG